ncbi:MAG: cytochrome c [Myxococcales bacterium]|nr:cytochrome c [Myxococcales bacterium]
MRSILLVMVGCAGVPEPDVEAMPADEVTPEDADAVDSEDLGEVLHDRDLQPLWDAHCTSCHQYGGGATFLPLTDAFPLLSQQDSTQTDLPLVIPGDPENSYLWIKLAAAERMQMERMPLYSPVLDDADLRLVRAWIEAGAQR